MKRLFVCLLLCLLASCSRKSDAELYSEGLAAEKGNDMPLALAQYAEAVERYPSTAYAESSQYRTAMVLMNGEGDKRAAAAAQLKFYAMFPMSANAPSMLFLAAFTYNNDLRNLDSAKLLYEEFLAKYPSHDMARSAQFELQTLGKSPNELIRDQRASDSSKVTSK